MYYSVQYQNDPSLQHILRAVAYQVTKLLIYPSRVLRKSYLLSELFFWL